jgi:hypothetical protein
MRDEHSDHLSSITLNFLPAKFSTGEVAGLRLDYEDKTQLRRLQDCYKGEFLLKRSGRRISAVPLLSSREPLDGEPHVFLIHEDWSLFARLLEEGIRRLLRSKYPSMNIPEFGPVLIRTGGEEYDLVRAALHNCKNILAKLGFVHIHRKYQISGGYVRRSLQDDPAHGVLISISTNWQIGVSIAELVSKGINVIGCYVVPLDTSQDSRIGHKIAGRIREINGTEVQLIDFRDQEVVDARRYTLEASLENVTKCANTLLDRQGSAAMRLIREEVSKLLSAEGQQQRIGKIAEVLSKEPIPCAEGVTATVSTQVFRVGSQEICTTAVLDPPKYMPRYGRRPVSGTISALLSSQGPFDQDSFKKTTPHILVITPKQYLGLTEQFLRHWRDGGPKPSYARGFIQQYHLRGCDFHFVDFQETSQGPANDYLQACLRALQESRDIVRRYDLAFVVIQERHRLLGSGDPYLITKAALMNEGVPVQEIEIETIDLPPDNQPFVLNNIALACYAKMGGTPWVLASPKGQGIAHELIIGLGSTILRDNRLQGQERYVGITTLFNYDGVYLLSNVSKESTYDEYSQALQAALLYSVKHVSAQKGWQLGDRVRLIFHTFKPLRNLEIESAKRLVQDNLSQYSVDFAFLVISDDHGWVIYDPRSSGFTDRRGNVRGRQVPKRGTAVFLDDYRALLAVTGPAELKMTDQGCPAPLQIKLNDASSFRDLEYLARQVFEFTYMSWKTLNLSRMPITITYSEIIANLLGRLRRIRDWNATVLQTTQLASSLWFL